MTVSTTDGDDESPSHPQFRGCVFCYGAEWLAYSAKRSAAAVRRRESE